MNKSDLSVEKLQQTISFDALQEAVQTIWEQVRELNQKIDNLTLSTQEPDENRFVGIDEILQTIYNKCCSGKLPHSRTGSRLPFNVKERRQWRDSLKKGGAK